MSFLKGQQLQVVGGRRTLHRDTSNSRNKVKLICYSVSLRSCFWKNKTQSFQMLKMIQTTRTKLFPHKSDSKKLGFSARVVCRRFSAVNDCYKRLSEDPSLGSPTRSQAKYQRTNDHGLMRKGLAVTETRSRCGVNGVRVGAAVRSRMSLKDSRALVGSLPDGPVTINQTGLQRFHLSQPFFKLFLLEKLPS